MSLLLAAICRSMLGLRDIAVDEPRALSQHDVPSDSYAETARKDPASGASIQALSSVASHSATPNVIPDPVTLAVEVTSTGEDKNPNPSEGSGSVHPDEDEAARLALCRRVSVALLQINSATYVSVSDCLVNTINQSAAVPQGESDCGGWALHIVACSIRRAASRDEHLAELLARLCRRMVEQLSMDISDGGETKDAEGNVLAGGQLFRRYMVRACQFGFDLRLVALGLAPGAPLKSVEGEDIHSDEDGYSSSHAEAHRNSVDEAKCHGPGLVKFVGELFKMGLLPEGVVHQCLKALLRDDYPDKADVKPLEDGCVLLTTVGQAIDTPKTRALVDTYFTRLKCAYNTQGVGWRTRAILKEVFELRARGWVPATDAPPPRGNSYDCNQWQWKLRDADAVNNWRKKMPLATSEEPLFSQPGVWAHSRLRKTGLPSIIS
ncbi:ARM repeat-containing protein [Pilatotrama ljubarskyi]|nr:ARM repeat-containing protein [Pilatotrama ljubarskyi]